MFWVYWILACVLNIVFIRELLKVFRRNDIDLRDGESKGVFFIVLFLSLIPFVNFLVALILAVVLLITRWIERKEKAGMDSDDITFDTFLDDVFRINKKQPKEQQKQQ